MAIYTDPTCQPPTSTALSICGRATLSLYTAFLRSPAAPNLHIISASLCTPCPVPDQVRAGLPEPRCLLLTRQEWQEGEGLKEVGGST